MHCNVLLAEDDDVAAEAIARGLKRHGVPFPLTVAEDGQVALDILRGVHPTKRIQRPLVILLDLNMPRMNGFEFLQALRSDPLLEDHVVFVLTTSSSDADRARAYEEHIAGYMVKSAVGAQFSQLARLLEEYASAVILPN